MPDTYARLTAENWTGKHTKVLLGVYRGKTDNEIAMSVGVKAATIQHYKIAPIFKEKLQAMANSALAEHMKKDIEQTTNGNARKALDRAQIEAARKIIKLMRKGTQAERLQFEAAKDILDRTGLKAIEVIETRERAYTPEEISRAKSTLNEVETIITRLENKDSSFLLARRTESTSTPEPKILSSSVTDKGSDAPTTAEDVPDQD